MHLYFLFSTKNEVFKFQRLKYNLTQNLGNKHIFLVFFFFLKTNYINLLCVTNIMQYQSFKFPRSNLKLCEKCNRYNETLMVIFAYESIVVD